VGVVTAGAETPLPERIPDRMTWWTSTGRVLLALLIGGGLWLVTIAVAFPDSGKEPAGVRPLLMVVVDPVVGVLATGLLLLRRRLPMTTGVVTTLLTLVSTCAVGAQTVVLCSVATRQRWREIVPLTLLTVAVGVAYTRLFPTGEPLPLWAEALIGLLLTAVIVAVGYSIGSRRALVRAWVDRAHTALAEQRARVAQARAAERTDIAREMHDVLAHRISLVSMHAGLLAYREDLPEEERRSAVAAINDNAHAALTDLREVLGVLRDPDSVSDSVAPQADLTMLEDLIETTRAAGTGVVLDEDVADLDTLPGSISRTAYRVLQEGLTNARKHAPGSLVRLTLHGGAGQGLEVAVTNRRSVAQPDAQVPGAGLGLLGLTERVELAGGELRHGWEGDDEHRLVARLPWRP